ncbi:uncharacterized protein UV8b_00615 [Ustilaginoidea virens]|uniref:Uncharacterized protein n=1 Tax=Ustilaginoidea virens TaxID=1159556 RepID=A0A8E5HJ66_USTVR|nr:uncharacterized protein UV8b_00615 [Ustilaginoidea virens]QUC16374.1 hypothetical protein UV8b_00615 [Ustilaginoidea virens]
MPRAIGEEEEADGRSGHRLMQRTLPEVRPRSDRVPRKGAMIAVKSRGSVYRVSIGWWSGSGNAVSVELVHLFVHLQSQGAWGRKHGASQTMSS